MKTRWSALHVVMILMVVGLVACSGGTEKPTEAVQASTTVPTDASPTDAPPPVESPTIIIPTVEPTQEPTATAEPAGPTATPVPAAPRSDELVFATFREAPVEVEPALAHEPIAADLSNVVVPFALSPAQRDRLALDGVVVSPGVEKEFFTVYERARYDNVPVFVTSDSLLHTYHLLFDKVLRTAERTSFVPLLIELNEAMLAETDAQYQALVGTTWEDSARRTVAFIGVGSQLLDPTVKVPGYAEELVAAELANIEAADGILSSPIFPGLEYGEDYTQYIPRGHYTRSEELRRYFKSMMWYGRMTFRLKALDPEVGRAETRSALLLVQALRTAQVNGAPAMQAWLDLYNPTVFFVGRSDDLTAIQYLDAITTIYGPEPTLADITNDERLDPFIEVAGELPPPRILGIVIQASDDEEQLTKGFRFMGQRFVPDAYIFRQLIYRNVGTDAKSRQLPKGLDIMSAMGSERAYELLDQMGETDYANYPEQMLKMRIWVSDLTVEDWTETLYTTWLYTLEPLLEVPGAGYPHFMQSNAWLDKQLNTSLGSWAELKHDTILYAKQVYAELGGGDTGAPSPLLAQGYVEPVPAFFARLEALTAMTLEGLDSRGLLDEQDRDSLSRIEQLAAAFKVMAEKELRGEPLSEEEQTLIRFYGGELEHLVMASADTEEGGTIPVMDEEPQAAVIADVATAPDPDGDGIPNPAVLEEAVGRINELYAVVPLVLPDGSIQLQVAKGGVFSYYEFEWPAEDRLTDEAWREMLDEGTAPAVPEWTASFTTDETEEESLRQGIYNFQRNLSPAYWNLDTSWALSSASDEVQDQFQAEMEGLRAEGHYIGHQFVHADYRSFDLQSETVAVVTVRESWQDLLYQIIDGPGDTGTPSDPIGRRGPYTLDVTYTLERGEYGWNVMRVVYGNESPGWGE